MLVRADLNVPMKNGVVTDATRIERQAPTIRELAEKGARVIVLSHFDRPKGKVVPEMSLKPIASPLAKAVGRPVTFASDCIGDVAKKAVAGMRGGDVLLLENTRFHAGEEKNDPPSRAPQANSATSSSTMRSRRRTARTRRPKASPICCRPPPGVRCRRNWNTCRRRWKNPNAR